MILLSIGQCLQVQDNLCNDMLYAKDPEYSKIIMQHSLEFALIQKIQINKMQIMDLKSVIKWSYWMMRLKGKFTMGLKGRKKEDLILILLEKPIRVKKIPLMYFKCMVRRSINMKMFAIRLFNFWNNPTK